MVNKQITDMDDCQLSLEYSWVLSVAPDERGGELQMLGFFQADMLYY